MHPESAIFFSAGRKSNEAVGTFAVQSAKASGARVTGMCNASKAGLVGALGADEVIDCTREDAGWGGIGRGVWASLLSRFVGQTLRMQLPESRADDLRVLRELVEADKLTPVIDRTFPLEQAADAIRYLVSGNARGKLVLTMQRGT